MKFKKKQLCTDIESYQLDLVCLQETKIANGADRTIKQHRLLRFESNSRHYGCGFLISKKWTNSINRAWKVSDRICVLQIIRDLEKPRNSTQDKTNIMPPHQNDRKNAPRKKETFYDQLSATIDSLENKSILFITGYFNAKIGKVKEGDTYTCLGKFSKGKRNNDGQTLLELCEEKRLFVSNSAFNHLTPNNMGRTNKR